MRSDRPRWPRLHVRHLVRSDGFAGVERYLTYLAPELVRRGHTVSVVGGEPAAMRAALAGTGVAYVPARTTAAVARAAVAGPRPDLLHAHMTAAELASVLASARLGVPVVATLHFGGGRGHSTATRLAYRAIGSRLDAEIAVSQFVAAGAGDRVVVVAPGIPTPGTDPDGAADDDRRPVVLVGQRLEPEKDTALALQAWASSGLAAEGWELHVAGRGSLDHELRDLARRVAPDGSIRFLGQQRDLAPLLGQASIVLAPAPGEPFGLTVVEAMARGLPVVAAAGGGHLETLAPASPDTLFPPGDATVAGDQLRRLAADPVGRARIGRDLRARFDAEYRLDRHAERLEAIYDRVTTSPRHGRPRAPRRAGDRLTVAIVFPACNREGGVERVVRELARRTASVHDVTFVGDRFDPEGMDGVRFLEVGGRHVPALPPPLSFRHRAAAALRTRAFDVTVTYGVECPPGDIAGVQSVHRAWLSRSGPIPTPVVDLPPRARFAMPRHVALLALERSYFSSDRLRLVLATSPATGDEVTGLYGVSADRVRVVPNGYDATEFHPGVRDVHRADVRARLGLGHSIVLLFVANEVHRKGLGPLIEAVARVGDPRLRIELVGRGSPAGYERRIAELGLTDRVRWNGPQADVAPWYAAADLMVLPTLYEPFGNVIVEALACGLPVITTAAAGASVAVVPDVNGLVQSDPTDADELAGLIGEALEPGRIERWSRDAATGLGRFDWNVVAGELGAAIDEVVAQRRAASDPR